MCKYSIFRKIGSLLLVIYKTKLSESRSRFLMIIITILKDWTFLITFMWRWIKRLLLFYSKIYMLNVTYLKYLTDCKFHKIPFCSLLGRHNGQRTFRTAEGSHPHIKPKFAHFLSRRDKLLLLHNYNLELLNAWFRWQVTFYHSWTKKTWAWDSLAPTNTGMIPA